MKRASPNNSRPVVALVIATVAWSLLSGCGGGSDLQEQPAADPRTYRCASPPGSLTDLAAEPKDWRSVGSGRFWTTANGCLLRMDVVADYDGPDHCGWESARFLVVGQPPGTVFRLSRPDMKVPRAQRAYTYVRDPQGVFNRPRTTQRLDLNATMPAAATHTGFRRGAEELWAVPNDPAFVYVRSGAKVERWPLEPALPQCA